MKKVLFTFALVMSIFLLSACSTDSNMETDTTMMLTIEELADYDGMDGNKAYIAVDGVIYDVTGNEAWTGGSHAGSMAGTDVSSVVDAAPHGRDVLDDLEVVGEIKD